MATPIRTSSSTTLREFTSSQENYIAYQVGLELAAATQTEVGSLNKFGSGTNIGTYTNSFFNEPVGTHPGAAITTGTTNTSIHQVNGPPAAETDSDFSLPIMWVDSASETGFKQMPDTDLNEAVDRYLSTIFTNEYPGAYRLASSTPSAGYFATSIKVTDTRTGGSSVTHRLYKKVTMSAPSTFRPMCVEDSAGGAGMDLKEMSDRKIRQTFGQRAKTRIMASKIGTHQLRSSTQGAPTDPGTWVARGTATDTKKQTVQQTFTRDSTVAFAINYTNNFVGTYTSNYTKLSQIAYTRAFATVPYQRLYTSDYELVATESFNRPYTAGYLKDYTNNYTRNYTIQYDRVYTVDYNIRYVGGNYQKEFAQAYIPNYNTLYTSNYVQNYVRNYTSVDNTGYATNYIPNYIRNYTPNYIRDFANSFQQGYARDFANSFQQGYARDFANSFATGYARDFANSFATGYARDFANSFATGYARDFANSFATGYARDFANSFQQGFARAFIGDYVRNYTQNYASNYIRNYTRNYSRSYTRELQREYYVGLSAIISQGPQYNRNSIEMTGYSRESAQAFGTPRNVVYSRGVVRAGEPTYAPNYIGYLATNYDSYQVINENFTPEVSRGLAFYVGAAGPPATTVPGGRYVRTNIEDLAYGNLQYTRVDNSPFAGVVQYDPTGNPGETFYARTSPASFYYFDNSQGFYTGPPTLTYIAPGGAYYQRPYSRTGLSAMFSAGNPSAAYLGEVRQTQWYSRGPTSNPSFYQGFDPNNTTWQFIAYYLKNGYTRQWGGIYYARNFNGYARNYLGSTSRYIGQGYLGDANYAGDYDLRPIGGALIPPYAGTANYTREFVGNYLLNSIGWAYYVGPPIGPVPGSLIDTYTHETGNLLYYVRAFANSFANTGFTATFANFFSRNFAGNYVQNYVRNYTRNFVNNYVRNYTRNFVNNYVRNYTRNFVNNYVRNYTRNFVNNYVRNYTRNFVNNYVRNYTRNFQGGFAGTSFATGFVGTSFVTNYVRTYTGNFARGFATGYQKEFAASYVGPNYTNNYVSNYDAPYDRVYTVKYTRTFNDFFAVGYQAKYAIEYINNYIRAYTGTYISNYVNEFANQYTGNYVGGYVADYVGDYQKEFTRPYVALYEQNYVGNFIGNFEGETIDSSSEVIETYTLYVRIA
tara:strand:+ start:9752 stop:13225 length:3474 start_codon:yes stop_codon:yes gene_type:complete